MGRRIVSFAGRLLVPAILVLLFGATDASAQKRVALVIGNGAYQKVPTLPNPPNDASDIAASLGRLGFTVRVLTDARFDEVRRGLIEFGREARGAEMALVYYAGHGMEIGGENWLVPVDAEMRNDTDAENEAISLRAVTAQVANASQLGMVILDACRNNPFAAKMKRSLRTRSVAAGLARTEPTDNVLIAYAAKDGTTAEDGDGRNSPFTTALLKNMETPGLEITFMFRNVRDEVMQATKREQQPFVYGSLSKEAIYLKSPLSEPATPVVVAPPVATAPPVSAPVVVAAVQPAAPPTVVPPTRVVPEVPASAALGDTDGPQAGGLFTPQDIQRVEAAAARNRIPLPPYRITRPDPSVPAGIRKFVGVWNSKVAFGGGRGRQMILIVTDVDASGRATGHYGFGPPTPDSFDQNPPSNYLFSGQIERDTLRVESRVATWIIKFTVGDNLHVIQQRKDGRSPTVGLDAVWRLADKERTATTTGRQVPRR
jgi:hypothetical protein